VAQDRTVVLDLLRAALAEVDERLVVRVRVSPEDVELVRTHWGDERAGLVIVGDERIAAGGCVIETRFGLVDARPETRLAEAEQLLWSVASDERGAARAGERG
jgi:flagellar assembly protein FliH